MRAILSQMIEQTLSLFKVDNLTKNNYERSMHICVGKSSMYRTYFISCLTTSALENSSSQCNQPDSNPGWCRPKHQFLWITRIHMWLFKKINHIFIHFSKVYDVKQEEYTFIYNASVSFPWYFL